MSSYRTDVLFDINIIRNEVGIRCKSVRTTGSDSSGSLVHRTNDGCRG
jgi:hypothetical protein